MHDKLNLQYQICKFKTIFIFEMERVRIQVRVRRVRERSRSTLPLHRPVYPGSCHVSRQICQAVVKNDVYFEMTRNSF
jgi:hypothetical protein